MSSFWLWLVVFIFVYVVFLRSSHARKTTGQRNVDETRASTSIRGTGIAHKSYVTFHEADDGETLWCGKPVQIEFEYCSAESEYTKRIVRVERIYKIGGANYFRGYCYLRNEERHFKLSRVLGNVAFEGKTISPNDFVKHIAKKV